jgi:4-amino-4-deoxy-L-arabinose transferase-like glycosyltransferase
MRQSAGKIFVWAILVAAIAVGYFLLSYNRTLNPPDEGYLLYNFHKTATGQVPHRDFYDDYGPGIYWLGAALFRLFGTKIIVIRIFLVVLKSVMAVLIFLIARKMMPSFFALIAGVLFILNWGDPLLPGINILYAGHLCHFLALVAVVAMIRYIEKGAWRWLMLASLCMGMSLLIKLPTAVMDLIGFSVVLCLKEQIKHRPAEPRVGKIPEGWRLLLRAGKSLGLVSVAVFYLALFAREHLDVHYFFIFLFPYFLILGHMLVIETENLRSSEADAGLLGCYREILILWAVPLVFWIDVLVYYQLIGGLDEFLYDMFELPLAIDFYRPMEDYRLHAGLAAAAVAVILLFTVIGKRLRTENETGWTLMWLAAAAAVILPPVSMFLLQTPYEVWHTRMTHVLPIATLLVSAWLFIPAWRRDRFDEELARPTLLLGLVFVFACQSFMMSFPRTDETHIQVNSTVLFILVAFLLSKAGAGLLSAVPFRVGILSHAISGLCVVVLSIPYVWSMKEFYILTQRPLSKTEQERLVEYARVHGEDLPMTSHPMYQLDYSRSGRLDVPLWLNPPLVDFIIADMDEAIMFSKQNVLPDQRIFVMCEAQILPFLAERESFLQKEDYFIFLATTDLIKKTEGIRLSDRELLRRILEERPPYVIQSGLMHSQHTGRILRIWPESVFYVMQNYRMVASFGIYQVWALK